jgi:hypothetical protein
MFRAQAEKWAKPTKEKIKSLTLRVSSLAYPASREIRACQALCSPSSHMHYFTFHDTTLPKAAAQFLTHGTIDTIYFFHESL